MIDLDPKIVDQEKIRKDKRKHMLKIAILPGVLLIVLFLMAFRQSFYNVLFSAAVKTNDAGFGNALTQMQLFSNYAEPYIAHYNEGIMRLKSGDYEGAEQSFRTSLKNDPPEEKLCDIYNNIAVSLELRADELVKTSTYNTAIELYTQGESMLYSSGCASRNDDEEPKDVKSDETSERISEKRSEAIAKMNAFTNNGSSNSTDNRQAIDDTTINDIKKKQREQASSIPSIRNELGNDGTESTTPW